MSDARIVLQVSRDTYTNDYPGKALNYYYLYRDLITMFAFYRMAVFVELQFRRNQLMSDARIGV
jgi:hypothetical protein